MPERRARRSGRTGRTGLTLLVSVLLLAGCGGGGPSATEWAGRVCDALVPWRAAITQQNQQAQAAIGDTASPAVTKQSLVSLLTNAQAATRTAQAAVQDAGDPAVDGGAEVERRFVASLSAAADAYGHALQSLARLDSTDPAFYDQVVVIMNTLTTEYGRSAVDTRSLSSPELQAAFDGLPQCR